MASIEQVSEKAALVNGGSVAEDAASRRSKATKKASRKPRAHPAPSGIRYFIGAESDSSTPQLVEERSSEVEAIAEAFRKQVSVFVVQEFRVDVETHKGAPLLRKYPVNNRSSP